MDFKTCEEDVCSGQYKDLYKELRYKLQRVHWVCL